MTEREFYKMCYDAQREQCEQTSKALYEDLMCYWKQINDRYARNQLREIAIEMNNKGYL